MLQLNDKEIRMPLISRLKNQQVKPKAIIEELRVHNGCAIADIVTLHNEAHCYEIKGDGDKIERILTQAEYYDLSFRKITLVTTTQHIEKALRLAPKYWGIMIAENKEDRVSFKYIRKARNNPNFNKQVALLSLWKEEMLELSTPKHRNNITKSRAILAEMIARTKQKVEISQNITLTLINRSKVNKYNQASYR